MAIEECRGCRYSKTKAPSLVCRRYPPTPNGGSQGVYPWIDPLGWCGEFMGRWPGTDLPAKMPAPRPPSDAATGVNEFDVRGPR